MTVRLRAATASDLPAVRDIYAPFVEETAITFAYDPPSVADLREKLRAKTHHPWLVCELGGEGDDGGLHEGGGHDDGASAGDVVGYASAGPVRERAAYQWAVETSVYVDPAFQRRGVARGLYTALLAILERQGYVSAYAAITTPNPASVGFHESFGFDHVGTFDAVGYKHGRWHDVEWWRRDLRPRPDDPADPLSVADARDADWWDDALARGVRATGGTALD